MPPPANPEDINHAQDTTAGPAGTEIATSPGGSPFVIPQSADFESLVAPFVDFPSAFEFAQGLGQENREAFLRNLNSLQARQTALDILGTDIEGIRTGAEQLAPFVREQGDLDAQANIERAGQLDRFNFRRLPEFNRFNRAEQRRAQEARTQAIEGAGLDFRGRISRLLDDLEAGTQGRLPAGLEEDFLRDVRDRGAEIASATGVPTLSGAGARASDRLLVGERIGISQRAQQLFPQVLGQAQQRLQAPEAPTLFAQPTQVPLNVSNIANRIPVQSNISAGALQQQIGTTATQLETIPATTALSANLGTQQFNEQARFSTDLTKLNAEQAQLNATDNAVQGAFNADKADEIRAQQFQQFQDALAVRERSETFGGISNILGSIFGASASTPEGGQSLGGKILDTVAGGVGGIIDAGAGIIDSVFGDGDGTLTVGKTEISGDSFGKFVDRIGDFFGREQVAPSRQAQAPEGTPAQKAGLVPTQKPETPSGTASEFKKLSEPSPLDTQTVQKAALTAQTFKGLSSSDQVKVLNDLGTDQLVQRGVLSPGQGQQLRLSSDALATLLNPNSSGAQRAGALTTIGAQSTRIPFTGDIRAPDTIRGMEVVSETQDRQTGERSHIVQDEEGNQFVFKNSDLVEGSNVSNAFQAIGVLTSNASAENKGLALASIGVDAAKANQIISQVQGGNALAALDLIGTAINFNDMSPAKQAVALTKIGLKTTNGLLAAFEGSKAGATGANAALSFLAPEVGGQAAATAAGQFISKALPIVGGAATIAQGIDTARDTIDAVKELPKGEARKAGAKGIQQAVTGLPSVPGVSDEASIGIQAAIIPAALVGGAIGAAIGQFGGSGKDRAQRARDQWKKAVVASGFGERIDDQVHVTLADGKPRKLFQDKKNLVNEDGTTRRNVDIDWDDEIATNSIPDAHLFAIASGLDPTEQRKLFHEAVGATTNVATEGVDSLEAAQENFKAMFKDKVDPRQLAMRIEMLRTTNKITEQEYGVYLDRANQLFGSQLQPSDFEKAKQFLISQLQGQGELKGPDKRLLRELTDPTVISKAKRQLAKRLEKDADNRQEVSATPKSPLPTERQDLRDSVNNVITAAGGSAPEIDTTVEAPRDPLTSPISITPPGAEPDVELTSEEQQIRDLLEQNPNLLDDLRRRDRGLPFINQDLLSA